jgi:phage terminase large subunit-like protein
MAQARNIWGGKGKPAPLFLRYLAHRMDHLEEARHDVNRFAEYCFIDKEGKNLKQGRIHREWQAALDANRRAIVIAPRGHGKSVNICQIRPLFELGNDPNLCIKIICANDQQAIKRVKALKMHMEQNTDLHRVFPGLKHVVHRGGRRPRDMAVTAGEWNLGSLTVPGRTNHQLLDPSIQSKSVLATISGDRSDINIWDDASDRKNSIEHPKLRQKIVEGVDDFINTLHPGTGRGWAVATLWHEMDLSHHFMKIWPTFWYEIMTQPIGDGRYRFGSKVWHSNGYKREDPNNPLWSYWNANRLLERLGDIGLRKFLRGFGNKPMLNEEQHIDPDWIRYWTLPPTADWTVILSIDAASTKGAQSNWTGFTFLAIHPAAAAGLVPANHQGAIKCFRAYHRKMTAPEKVKAVEHIYRNLANRNIPIGCFAVENRGGGQELMDYLLERGKIPRRLIQPVRPASSKTDRVDRISHYVENGTVEFHPDMDTGLGGSNVSEEDGNVISELVSMPLGEYDDLADSFSQGVLAAVWKYKGLRSLAAAIDRDEMDGGGAESGGSIIVI